MAPSSSTPTRMARRRRLGAMLVAGSLALAACGEGGDDGAPVSDPGPTVETGAGEETTAFDEPTPDDSNRPLPSEDDLDGLQPTAMLDVEVDPTTGDDPTALVVSFEMGSHHCYGVRSEVVERTDEVVIGLQTGVRAGIDPSRCPEGSYPYTTVITLDTPLGGRTIVPAGLRDESETPETGGSTDPTPTTTGDVEATADEPVGEETTPDASPGNPPGEREGSSTVVGAHLIGELVGEGIDWAIDQGIEWRVIDVGDGAVDQGSGGDGPDDPNRISFLADGDRIVGVEWS